MCMYVDKQIYENTKVRTKKVKQNNKNESQHVYLARLLSITSVIFIDIKKNNNNK